MVLTNAHVYIEISVYKQWTATRSTNRLIILRIVNYNGQAH